MNEELVDRNSQVLEMYEETHNISLISRTFGISLVRVRQILDREGVRQTKSPDSAGQYKPRWRTLKDRSKSGNWISAHGPNGRPG